MWGDAALLTASCVLFIQMGLSEAVQEKLGIRSQILSCVKCCTFWTNLIYMSAEGQGVLDSVAAAFVCSYAGMWGALAYDGAALYYNRCYEKITNQDTETEGGQTPPDAVS